MQGVRLSGTPASGHSRPGASGLPTLGRLPSLRDSTTTGAFARRKRPPPAAGLATSGLGDADTESVPVPSRYLVRGVAESHGVVGLCGDRRTRIRLGGRCGVRLPCRGRHACRQRVPRSAPSALSDLQAGCRAPLDSYGTQALGSASRRASNSLIEGWFPTSIVCPLGRGV